MDHASACLLKKSLDFPTIRHYEYVFPDFRTFVTMKSARENIIRIGFLNASVA